MIFFSSYADQIQAAQSKAVHPSLQAVTSIYVSYDDMVHREPISIYKALQYPHWTQVVQEELSTLSVNQIWSIVPLPYGRILIGCKLLFRIKRNTNEDIAWYKGQIVAKGFS